MSALVGNEPTTGRGVSVVPDQVMYHDKHPATDTELRLIFPSFALISLAASLFRLPVFCLLPFPHLHAMQYTNVQVGQGTSQPSRTRCQPGVGFPLSSHSLLSWLEPGSPLLGLFSAVQHIFVPSKLHQPMPPPQEASQQGALTERNQVCAWRLSSRIQIGHPPDPPLCRERSLALNGEN